MIIGIDAGGTYTKASLFHENGSIVDTLTMDSMHPLQVGYASCGKALAKMIEVLCMRNKIHPSNVSVGLGLAGYGQDPAIRLQIENALTCYLPCAYTIKNDVQVALYGALNGEDGIIIVAGTGSIALAKKGNEFYRCGGFGYRIGDEGSAYWMGRKCLEIFSKQCDARLPQSKLHSIVCATLQLADSYKIISYLEQHPNRSEIAKLAEVVYHAAKKKDPYACSIYDEAAHELASCANVLCQSFQQPVKVSYSGGVFKSGDYIIRPLKKYLAKELQLVPPLHDPVKGAYMVRHQAIRHAI